MNLTNAVSCCPVCSPYRASLMTGRYPLTHGVFMNDVCLGRGAVSLAEAFAGAGYDTAYIGKWHLDGHGRTAFTPPERRHGWQFWRAIECTHNYNHSAYYADDPVKRYWEGYDAIAQTREAQRYIRERAGTANPFILLLSWGPPHDPYQTAPEKYRAMYRPEGLAVRPNVPPETEAQARIDLAGYYAHCAALDECLGELRATLRESGIEQDTILVFTSDHGDLLGSHGGRNKQQPWDESVRVPLLLRWPDGLGAEGRCLDVPVGAPDLMPTLLGLAGVGLPATVEGRDLSAVLRGQAAGADVEGALIMCVQPFGQWSRARGGKEYRGVRTRTHTYVRDLAGPWLLFDNQRDPYQQNNLAGRPEATGVQQRLEELLGRLLRETRDDFRPGAEYVAKWGYTLDKTGTVPYEP